MKGPYKQIYRRSPSVLRSLAPSPFRVFVSSFGGLRRSWRYWRYAVPVSPSQSLTFSPGMPTVWLNSNAGVCDTATSFLPSLLRLYHLRRRHPRHALHSLTPQTVDLSASIALTPPTNPQSIICHCVNRIRISISRRSAVLPIYAYASTHVTQRRHLASHISYTIYHNRTYHAQSDARLASTTHPVSETRRLGEPQCVMRMAVNSNPVIYEPHQFPNANQPAYECGCISPHLLISSTCNRGIAQSRNHIIVESYNLVIVESLEPS